MALTDISGIGAKTAEKLKQEGIDNPRELAEARRRGDPALQDFSSRVQRAARDEAVDRFEAYQDPGLGVEVTEQNRGAVETFAGTGVGELNDAGRITRNNSELQDASLLDLGRKAVQGGSVLTSMRSTPTQEEITDTIVTINASGPNEVEDRDEKERRQVRRNIAEMGFDAAANVSSFDRETVKEANRLREEADARGQRGVKTDFAETYTSEIAGEEKEFEREIRVSPREYAAAQRVHQARPQMAKRVDSRRKAEVTGDFDEWVEDPRRHDYPGVDTPGKGAEAGRGFGFEDGDTEIRADPDIRGDGFQVETAQADGGGGFGRVESNAGKILSAPQEQQQIVLGGLLPSEEEADEIGLEPRGPDKELFSSGGSGGFF